MLNMAIAVICNVAYLLPVMHREKMQEGEGSVLRRCIGNHVA